MQTNSRKKLSIISACYNEKENIPPLYERLLKVLENLDYDFEIIYVDNASTDDSEEVYRQLCQKDKRVRAILMSRNFGGPQPSYFAGLEFCSGDAAILIDGDLQDPPELIPELIKKWKEGYDVVYGIRKKRQENIIKVLAYKLFYLIFRKLAYMDVPLNAGEFGLMDRRVINHLVKFPEREVFIRGLRAYTGFRQTGVEYIRQMRNAGKSTTSFARDLMWARRIITNFSYKPLEWISYLTFAAFLVAFGGMALNLILYLINPDSSSGIPTIIFAIFFLGGVQLLALSIIGEYLARVLQEVKNRPRYIIREILNEKSQKYE